MDAERASCGPGSEGATTLLRATATTVYVGVATYCDTPIVRLRLVDGVPDATWAGGDGVASLPGSSLRLARDSGGRLVSLDGCTVGRALGDGSLDTTWDGDGVMPAPAGMASCQGMAVDASGAVYVAGVRGGAVTVARLRADGSGVDPMWGAAGFAAFPGAVTSHPEDVVVDHAGRVLVGAGVDGKAFLGRLLDDGTGRGQREQPVAVDVVRVGLPRRG
ncbi:MAG: hypothetical protein JWO69_1652 [Thermoleophilia bacterium]|nr:hypothetical protein [Thermoleophilia bacterium]